MVEENELGLQGLRENDLLLAIATILADGREQALVDHPEQVKTELLLANVGLSYGVIARILGKKPDAVRMTITRARAGQSPSKKQGRGLKRKESAETGQANA